MGAFDDLVPTAKKGAFDDLIPRKGAFDDLIPKASTSPVSNDVEDFLSSSPVKHEDLSKFIKSANINALSPSVVQAESAEALTPEYLKSVAPIYKAVANAPLIQLPKPENTGVISGVTRGIESTAEGLTSPTNLALLASVGGAPAAIQRIVAAGFAAHMAHDLPEKIQEIADSKTTGEVAEKLTESAAQIAMIAAAGGHAGGRPRAGGALPAERTGGFTTEEANRAAVENQQRALVPEVSPAPKDVQPVTPEALDALHLSREKLTQGFNGLAPEVKAERQASIDDIDNQLLRADRTAVDASALRVAQRDKAPPAPEVPSESAPASPPADTVTEPVTEQASQSEGVHTEESVADKVGAVLKEGRSKIQEASDREKAAKESGDKEAEEKAANDRRRAEDDLIDRLGTDSPLRANSTVADRLNSGTHEWVEGYGLRKKTSAAPVIDETVAKTYADSAERIADQVAKGQPTTVREAARDAALDNAMGSLRAGKTPSVSFMRKSAQTAAGAHADRLGESLDAPVGEGEMTKLDQEAAPAPKPENTELLSAMDKAIGGLSEREAKIVRGVQEGRTLDDIATEHGLSKQRISQIVQESLPKLRSALEDAGFTKDDYAGGPGAMGPVEALEMKAREVDTTGLKRAVVDTERLARGAEPIPTAERQREEGVVRAAEDKAAEDPTAAPSLISRIVDGGDKAISEHDAALLLVERARLMNERKAWEERLGRGEDVNTAKTRLSEIENETERLDRAQRAAGTTWGRLGHMYQRMIRDDYTLEAMERKMRASVERPLTEPEKAKLKEQSEEIQRLQKELEDKQTSDTQAREDEGVRATIEATINELGKSYLKKPTYGKEVFDAARKIVDNWKSEADKARERLKNTAYFSSIGPSTAEIRDLALIVRAYVGEFGLTKAEAGARLVSEFGPKVKPHIDKIWSATKAAIAGEKTTEKVKNATKEGLKKEGEPTTAEAAASAKADAVAGDALDKNTVGKVVRALINDGVHGEGPLMEGAHKILKEAYPDITERDVRRTFSDYGKAKFPSKDAVKVEERELRNLVRLQESIDRIQKDSLDPLKTGLQRDKATQLVREKQKQLNELLKKRGGAPSPEKLAAGQEARRTALKNRIEDIDKELKTGVKQPKSATVPDDVQTEQLRAERDAMQAKLDEIEREANPPEPEHVQELKRLQDRIDETRDRLARLDLEKPPGKATVDTPEIAAAKAELKQLNDTIAELRKPTAKSAADKQVEQLAKTRDKITETLSGKRPPNAPKDWNPLSAEAENIKAEIQALNELAAQMKRDAKPPTDPNAAKERAQIRSLEDAIRNYEDKLAKGDFSTNGKMHGPDTAKVAALKAIRDARKGAYDAAKKAGKPVLTPEERYNATRMKAIEKRMKDLEAIKASGKFVKPPKPAPKVKLQGTKDAEVKLARLKKEVDAGFERERLKNRTPSQKFWDHFVGIERAMKLSSDVVLAKLGTAAIAREGILTPIEEGVGGVVSKLIPGIAERAPREGGLNFKAEAKAKAAAFTSGMKDAWQNLQMKQSDLESLYGKSQGPPSWYEYFGFLHGALKAPIKRAEFTRSLEKRMENYRRNGGDLNDLDAVGKMSQEAYVDANRAIFMQDNVISNGFNMMLRSMENSKKFPVAGPGFARLARFLVPIVKVPTNIVGEAATGVHGVATGSVQATRAYLKGVQNLPPEQADLILRNLKKGLVGNAFLLTGYFAYKSVGGFYQDREKRDAHDTEPEHFKVGGVDLPAFTSHTNAAILMNIGATYRRQQEKGKSIPSSAGAATSGLIRQLPFIPAATSAVEALKSGDGLDKYMENLLVGSTVPAAVAHAAKVIDTPGSFPSNALKHPNRRSPQNLKERFKEKIPGLRQTVPSRR